MAEPAVPVATGLSAIDWGILGLYLVACIAIGWWAMGKVSDAGGYLLARRKLGKVMSLAATFSGGVNANDPVAVTSKVYSQGISGIWTALNFLLLTPWFWMRDAVGRRVRLVTPIDVIELRYGQFMKWLTLGVGIFGGIINIGLGIKAAAVVTVGVAGGSASFALIPFTGDADADAMILASAIVVLPTMAYTLMGGILAACATDVFMSVLIIVLSFVVIPYAWHAVGGLDAVRNGLPPGHLDLVSGNALNDFTFWGIVWFMIMWIFSLGPAPSAAKDEMTARIGSLGLLFKRFCTLGWASIGLFGVILYAGTMGMSAQAGDQVFARMSVELLPTGLRGVMVAAILAAAMSTIASMALAYAGPLLNNVWRPLVAPQASAGHYLLIARIITAIALILAWGVSISNSSDIFTWFTYLAQIGGLMGVCTLAAYMWRRATAAGAIASVAVMLPPLLITMFGGDIAKPWSPAWDWVRTLWVGWLGFLEAGYRAMGVHSVGLLRDAAGTITGAPVAIRFPAQLIPGIAALVAVSLMTRQHHPRHVEEFYARLDTPVGDEHLLAARGIKVDLLQDLGSDADVTTRDPSRRLLFLDLLYLPRLLWRGEAKLSDYKVDFLGILGTGLFVAGFVWMFLSLLDWLRPAA